MSERQSSILVVTAEDGWNDPRVHRQAEVLGGLPDVQVRIVHRGPSWQAPQAAFISSKPVELIISLLLGVGLTGIAGMLVTLGWLGLALIGLALLLGLLTGIRRILSWVQRAILSSGNYREKMALAIVSIWAGRLNAVDTLVLHELSGLALVGVKHLIKPAKVVFDAHEIYWQTAYAGPNAEWTKNYLKAKLQGVDRISVAAGPAKQAYREIAPHAHIGLVTNGGLFQNTPERPALSLRQALGLDADAPIILYQGAFSHERGLEDFAIAAAQAPEGWHFVVQGEGPLRDELYELGAGRLKILERSPLETALAYQREATIGFCGYKPTNPNHSAAQPNKLYEFSAAGLPVIVGDVPRMRRYTQAFDLGWTLPEESGPADILALLASLSKEEITERAASCLAFTERQRGHYKRSILRFYGLDQHTSEFTHG